MAKFEYMERAFSSELRPRARLVLQVLVLHCNKEGECFPSIKTIAAKCAACCEFVSFPFSHHQIVCISEYEFLFPRITP